MTLNSTNKGIETRLGGASLDVLRFCAALFILIFHFYENVPQRIGLIDSLLHQGWLATNFFLMLSGFVMSRAYAERITSKRLNFFDFMGKRYARLLPSHIVVLLGFGAIVSSMTLMGFKPNNASVFGLKGFIEQLTLVYAWGFEDTPSWNVATWTISALIVCYAIYALVIPYLNRLSRLQIVLIGCVILLVANLIAHFAFERRLVSLSLQFSLGRALPFFFLGVLSELLVRGIRLDEKQFLTYFSLTIFTIMCLTAKDIHSVIVDNIIIILTGTMIAIASVVNYRETMVTRELGKTSYSLFLVHGPIQVIAFRALGVIDAKISLPEWGHWLAWGSVFLFSLFAAFVFRKLVDAPLEKVFRKGIKLGGVRDVKVVQLS